MPLRDDFEAGKAPVDSDPAAKLFWAAIDWLRESYSQHQFFVERDVVWTVQKRLIDEISRQGLPYRVFNDFPVLKGKRRGISADLVLLGEEGTVAVAAEFKYEPWHGRGNRDILPSKFPVVEWGIAGVAKDIDRIRNFVEQGAAQAAFSLFIDEGGYFSHREPHSGSRWERWNVGEGTPEISVLISATNPSAKFAV